MNPLEGVTDQTIQLPVTPGQYAQLEQDRIMPGRERVIHKIGIGPFAVPGNWVVTATQRHQGNEVACWVTLSRLED